jgi:cytochrome P450
VAVQTTGCPHIDFTSDDAREHLHEMVAELRATCPVTWTDAHDGYWVLTRYADVLRVFQDWEGFTSTEGVVIPRINTPLRALPMECDPPEHRDYRQALNPHLSPAGIAHLEDGIRQIVVELIDAFIADGRCDLVGQFAQHVSSTVLFRLILGAAEEDMARCHESVKYFAFDPTSEQAARAALELMQFCYRLVTERRQAPRRGDILDSILAAPINGKPIDDMQAVGVVALLIFGGFDTTANAIGTAVLHLIEQPAVLAQLRADPALIASTLDEFLRLDPPVIGLARRATRDVEIDGHVIEKGQAVYLSLVGANRDPDEFADPETLVPGRSPNRHVTFSAGVHRCAGSHLGRLMLRVALEELLGRLDDIALAGPVEYYQAAARGLRRLEITFGSSPSAAGGGGS